MERADIEGKLIQNVMNTDTTNELNRLRDWTLFDNFAAKGWERTIRDAALSATAQGLSHNADVPASRANRREERFHE